MKKFSEIEYVRPDMEAEQEKVRAYTKALKEAKSYEELRGLFMEEKTREDAWATMAEVAQVRYTVDTRDSFYEGEVQFWNETIPAIHLLIQKAEKVILESPFIKEFAEEFGEFFVKNMEVGQKLADDCIVEDLIEEANLTQQYSKITANASTEFKGKTCNFYGLLKAMQSTDRQMRKEAMTAWGDLYEEISGELDALYDKMVPVLAGHLFRVLLVVGVEGNQHLLCLLLLFFRLRVAVDVREHQLPQQAHSLGNLRRLAHILRSAALLHNIVNQRIEPLAARIAKNNADRNRDVILA